MQVQGQVPADGQDRVRPGRQTDQQTRQVGVGLRRPEFVDVVDDEDDAVAGLGQLGPARATAHPAWCARRARP
jgi:hypothetical protein